MIYISCPSNHATGGTELLHQLCHAISRSGIRCILWYFDAKSNIDPTPERFKQYRCNFTIEKPLMQELDALIVPETLTDLLYEFDKGKKFIWWLSVDFYERTFRTKRYFVRRYLNGAKFFRFEKDNNLITHIYQSEYARQYLIERQARNIAALSDYISESFNRREDEIFFYKREKVVLYNPKKGMETTKKLIEITKKIDKNIAFIALEGMTPMQMAELMLKASIYIDFGNHPGKDRMPREAAALGCVIITGTKGSAGNNIDVPIPKKYKFEIEGKGLNSAVDLIVEVSRKHEDFHPDFLEYRKIIAKEKMIFERQVKELLALTT